MSEEILAMRLNLDNAPPHVHYDGVQVGDVYPVLGGANMKARWKVVVSITGNTVVFLTFNQDGEVVGATQYGLHAVEKRYRVGRVTNLGPLEVEWDARP